MMKINGCNGYYTAFSLSSDKEIKVNYGDYYNFIYQMKVNQFYQSEIFKYNNLEKIVSCYMQIIENNILKIINHPQIQYYDSLKFFYPMLTFFGNTAFNDEYIIKNYIIKFFYKNYDTDSNSDVKLFFDRKYNFLYSIIQTVDSTRTKKLIFFFLDCLIDEIKYYSNNKDKSKIWNILIQLYSYLSQKKLFYEILFKKDSNKIDINNKIKSQLFIIFQSRHIFGINFDYNNKDNISEEFINQDIRNCLMKAYNKINFKIILKSFAELIKTLLSPIS